jgi:hypothetical protein
VTLVMRRHHARLKQVRAQRAQADDALRQSVSDELWQEGLARAAAGESTPKPSDLPPQLVHGRERSRRLRAQRAQADAEFARSFAAAARQQPKLAQPTAAEVQAPEARAHMQSVQKKKKSA